MANSRKSSGKQLFIEVNRIDKPLETTEERYHASARRRLSVSAIFQTANHKYLPRGFSSGSFALIDLSAYHSKYLGKRYLKTEIYSCFSDSHAFVYHENIFMFLHNNYSRAELTALAKEFQLKIIVSDD